MKDITRIHIAKVPYNVELSAKKKLETYITALETYTADSELLADIEIRMTELLLERGVKQDDVISEADVAAIREQLGEPKEFMTDDATLEVDEELLSKDGNRKLYRNVDTGILGGVLSGIASYFQISVWWPRLIFIALTFVSFGLFALLYVALWLFVPAARTAAQKLQMAGQPVTLSSIRTLNEATSYVNVERRAAITKRIMTTILGVVALFGVLGAIAMLAGFTFGVLGDDFGSNFESIAPYQLAIVLGYVAGALLITLFLLIAIAAFTQKFNKRIWVSGIIIIALGLSTFGAAIVSLTYQRQVAYDEVQRNTTETSLALPADFKTVKSLSVDVPASASVVYVVDDNLTSMKIRTLKDAPKAQLTVDSDQAKVTLAEGKKNSIFGGTGITIYGPRLDKIIVSNGYASYDAGSQSSLKVEVYNAASLRLVGSRVDALTVKTDGTAQLSADEAAVAAVKVSLYGQSSVSLGNIKTLEVANTDVCASNQIAQLSVENIISATYVQNGIEVGAKSTEGPCLDVRFAKDEFGGDSGYQD